MTTNEMLKTERQKLQQSYTGNAAGLREFTAKDEANAEIGRVTNRADSWQEAFIIAEAALIAWDNAHPGFANALILAGEQGITVPHSPTFSPSSLRAQA